MVEVIGEYSCCVALCLGCWVVLGAAAALPPGTVTGWERDQALLGSISCIALSVKERCWPSA